VGAPRVGLFLSGVGDRLKLTTNKGNKK
jgi:hypothetical protein